MIFRAAPVPARCLHRHRRCWNEDKRCYPAHPGGAEGGLAPPLIEIRNPIFHMRFLTSKLTLHRMPAYHCVLLLLRAAGVLLRAVKPCRSLSRPPCGSEAYTSDVSPAPLCRVPFFPLFLLPRVSCHALSLLVCVLQVRRLWASEAAKLPILEFSLEKALAGLDLTMDQFVDVCILAGCDYCESIKGERHTRWKHARRCNNVRLECAPFFRVCAIAF